MTAFIQNSIGFFIQFFPCALMIFLPFSREDYRFRPVPIFVCLTLASAALSLTLPFLLHNAAGGNTAFVSNIFMFSAILLTLAAYIWLVRESLTKKIMVFIVVVFYAALQYYIVNSVLVFLSGVLHVYSEYAEWSLYSSYGLMLYVLTTAVLLPIMLTFVMRMLREYINKLDTRNMNREFFILALSTAIFFVMIICVDFSYYYFEYKQYLIILTLFLVLLLYQILVYWLIFRESVRIENDNEHRRAMEIKQLQYEKIVGDMESTRRMRHDMRHHYNSLNDMLERGKLDEMKNYLSNLIDTTVKRDSEIYCKNMTVNGILQYYIGLARDEGIKCDVRAKCGELNIEPADLTVLFANSLENAIRACKKCPENRRISIKIGTVQGSLAIEISNSCVGVRLNRRFQNEDGFSPAEAFLSDRANVGHGLKSIAYTAQKYGGSAKFRFNAEKEIFTTRIRININVKI